MNGEWKMKEETTTNNGFVKLDREIVNWEWYQDSKTKDIFIHCLVKANYNDKKWQGTLIKRGSFVTSYDRLAKELNMSVQNIRTGINKLKSTGELTSRATTRNTTLIVNNYNLYQITNKPTNNQLTTTKKIIDNSITVRDFKFSVINENFIDDVFTFKKIVESVNCLPSKANFDSWATSLRLLHNQVGEKQYLYALNWYSNNIGKQYIPECYSAISFREKWDKIVMAIKREKK
jgi:hypothetical protein